MHVFKKNKEFKVDSENYLFTQLSKSSAFRIIESYKTIRTNLLFSLSASKDNVAVFTSYEPNAGKSITSANIAITMAQTGAHILLIDADMRNPSQHKIFRIPNANGLSKLLSGLSDINGDAVNVNATPNLDVITAGPVPPNPSELLGSSNMAKLLAYFRQNYDYIFIDSPPVGAVSDALVLLSHAPNAVVIARQKQTYYEDIKKAIESVRGLNGSLLGVVITDVNDSNKAYGSSYSKKRYYTYGYEK